MRINCKLAELTHRADEEYFLEVNREFHSIIWKAARSPRLVGMLRLLYDASRSYRYISVILPGRAEEIVGEHENIVAALRRRDADAVEKTVNEHYRHTLEWLMRSRQDAA